MLRKKKSRRRVGFSMMIFWVYYPCFWAKNQNVNAAENPKLRPSVTGAIERLCFWAKGRV